jgi:osmotically-inducible protein OsmY
MMEDYEDLYDIDELDDEELADLIEQELSEYPAMEADSVEIEVRDGFVRLIGRVGTEQELQAIDQLIGEVLGIESYGNELVVDELLRLERSEAADEAYAEDRDASETMLREPLAQTDPQAQHLIEDTATELYGTQDMSRAIEEGAAYEAPDRPFQEGHWSEEDH